MLNGFQVLIFQLKKYRLRLFQKVLSHLWKIFKQRHQKLCDDARTTYETGFSEAALNHYYTTPPLNSLRPTRKQILQLTKLFRAHRFNLLGSGWQDCNYHPSSENWHGKFHRVNTQNTSESERIRGMIDNDYNPIDWYQDFKSGYRWPEMLWYAAISYEDKADVEIKIPWELARMQHLPLFVWAYIFAENGDSDFEDKTIYRKEFENQALDFVSSNPPRFGVNWACTMDVAIRIVNWLTAYDLFRAAGARFGREFEAVFIRSVYEHGRFIFNNLENKGEFLGNHYLSNIAGLLFVAAYLPNSQEVDEWLTFAVQELIKEVKNQFYQEGSNFEASTCYHHLSAEMVVYATALILGLPTNKLSVINKNMCMGNTPIIETWLETPGFLAKSTVDLFPRWYYQRLHNIAHFTNSISVANGRFPQIGDNDSGHFLIFSPNYIFSQNEGRPIDDPNNFVFQSLNNNHLLAAINGLFHNTDLESEMNLETEIVHSLAKGNHLPIDIPAKERTSLCKQQGLPAKRRISNQTCSSQFQFSAYPAFGLFIYRTRTVFFAIRCGDIGQNGCGGHGHNDQLSFVLFIKEQPIIVDPGTYLYTSNPAMRNKFRSTRMHNTLQLEAEEQNNWISGYRGLFRMEHKSRAEVISATPEEFIGEHFGFHRKHNRSVRFDDNTIVVQDECNTLKNKCIFFHLAPDVSLTFDDIKPTKLILKNKDLNIKLYSDSGESFEAFDSLYSRGYGEIEKSKKVCIKSTAQVLSWHIELI